MAQRSPKLVQVAVLACLLCEGLPAHAQVEPNPLERPDALQVVQQKHIYELSWRDAEDSVKGAVLPIDLREGEPLKVTLRVGTFEGPPFTGPVTLTLRADGDKHGETKTVTPEEGTWAASFVPRKPGKHLLDVSFRTTRLKLLHAELHVRQSRLPRELAWALGGLITALALALGVWRMFRKPTQPPLAS